MLNEKGRKRGTKEYYLAMFEPKNLHNFGLEKFTQKPNIVDLFHLEMSKSINKC